MIATLLLLFGDGINVEDEAVIIHQIHIFQGHIFISVWTLDFLAFFNKDLPFVGSSFDVVTLINVYLLVKNIANNDEVNCSIAAFIFHLVKTIYSDKVTVRIFFNIKSIVFNYFTQFHILLSTDRLHNNLRIVSIVHETSTFTFINFEVPSDVWSERVDKLPSKRLPIRF